MSVWKIVCRRVWYIPPHSTTHLMLLQTIFQTSRCCRKKPTFMTHSCVISFCKYFFSFFHFCRTNKQLEFLCVLLSRFCVFVCVYGICSSNSSSSCGSHCHQLHPKSVVIQIHQLLQSHCAPGRLWGNEWSKISQKEEENVRVSIIFLNVKIFANFSLYFVFCFVEKSFSFSFQINVSFFISFL